MTLFFAGAAFAILLGILASISLVALAFQPPAVAPVKPILARKQSRPARCERMCHEGLAGRICGAQLQMLVTKSPLSALPYEELFVLRCALHTWMRADGILPDVCVDGPNSNYGCW